MHAIVKTFKVSYTFVCAYARVCVGIWVCKYSYKRASVHAIMYVWDLVPIHECAYVYVTAHVCANVRTCVWESVHCACVESANKRRIYVGVRTIKHACTNVRVCLLVSAPVYVRMRMCGCAYGCTCVRVWVRASVSACECECVQVWVRVSVGACECECVRVWVRASVNACECGCESVPAPSNAEKLLCRGDSSVSAIVEKSNSITVQIWKYEKVSSSIKRWRKIENKVLILLWKFYYNPSRGFQVTWKSTHLCEKKLVWNAKKIEIF